MSDSFPNKMTAEAAEALLKARLGSRVIDLHVRFHEVGITLKGTAYSYYAKQLAQHAAMHLLGLPIVANEIEVRMVLRSWEADEMDLA